MLFFQLLELPGFAPLMLALLIIIIRKNYFNRPGLKFAFEWIAGVGIAASIVSILMTTKFNEDIFALKVSNNPAGWYMFTFIELFAALGFSIYKQRSLVLAVLATFAAVGLHEFIWWLGQGPGIGTYINMNEFLWAGIVYPAAFVVLLIFKVNWKLYFIPMLAYLIIGLLIPWFFSPVHNDLVGWTLCFVTTSLALSPKKFGNVSDHKIADSNSDQSNPQPLVGSKVKSSRTVARALSSSLLLAECCC
jgi:hypothetical protein